MSDPATVLDPTAERAPAARARTPRTATLQGRTVGILDIAKARGDVFLDRLEERFAEQGATVRRYAKPTFTRVAPTELSQQVAAECDVVVEGLAD